MNCKVIDGSRLDTPRDRDESARGCDIEAGVNFSKGLEISKNSYVESIPECMCTCIITPTSGKY